MKPNVPSAACAAFALALAISGCTPKMEFTVAGQPLPDLAGTPSRLIAPTQSPAGHDDGVMFPQAKLPQMDKYVDYLSRNGWTKQSENADVVMTRIVFTKRPAADQSARLLLEFSGASGLTISGRLTKTAAPAAKP